MQSPDCQHCHCGCCLRVQVAVLEERLKNTQHDDTDRLDLRSFKRLTGVATAIGGAGAAMGAWHFLPF